ncbi:MAG: hypothetical protein N2557_00665 [Hydrogenophilus sp.]|nr:hypothetical protein [Hydrogenophilus sp.]
MMNRIFLILVLFAYAVAAWHDLTDRPGAMQTLGKALLEGAQQAVTLALGLIGAMSLFLGLTKVAEAGGLLRLLARLLQPIMTRLFPDVPRDHPAMGAMVMNFAANMLGLGNAATPFGIRAMEALNRLNPHPGTATNAMAMFLAINTSGLTLLPTGVIALRATLGSAEPAAILPTTLFATTISTLTAFIAATLLGRLFPPPSSPPPPSSSAPLSPVNVNSATPLSSSPSSPRSPAFPSPEEPLEPIPPLPAWAPLLFFAILVLLVTLAALWGSRFTAWLLPTLVLLFLLFGWWRRIPVYETFIEGAKEGFTVAQRIIPYLVAILVAIAMLRASGALTYLIASLSPLTTPLGLPPEALPMALLRPLSGSGAYAVMAGIMADPATGPDTKVGWIVSTIQGSTETTFYVLAVYFGAVGITRVRHTLAAALLADLAGIGASVWIVHQLYPE